MGLTDTATPLDWERAPVDRWRAITVKGPWDFPIVAPHGARPAGLPAAKLCENRPWSTTWRGPLILHSGKGWDPAGERNLYVQSMWRAIIGRLRLRREAWLWAGSVTAVAQVVGCHPAAGCCRPWGQSGPGVFHLVLADVRVLTEPVEARGLRRLWRPDAELVERVRPLIPPLQEAHLG